MQNDNNPFKAPTAQVADLPPDSGDFIAGGRSVPAGNGLAWLGGAWELFRAAPGIWIGLCVAYLLLMVVLGMIPLVNFLLGLLAPVFAGGIMIGCKALDDGDELTIGHLFAGFSGHAGNLFLVGLIYMAGVVGVVLLMLLIGGGIGFSLFVSGAVSPMAMIVPILVACLLIVPLAMAVWYAPALVVFHQQTPFEAMKASFFVSIKNFLPFLVYSLVIIVLAILASLPFFLGWLVLIPVLQASIYVSYKDMFTES
ncbi:MAG: BPSS1780 family membrane protein [Azonexus sp.]